VTRDAWVSAVGAEADGNNGGAPRLKLKSIQEMSLVDIDPKPLVGRTIRSATLHLKKAADERLERVTTSAVGAEWFEGTATNYAVEPGGVTFRHRRHPDLAWSINGGDLCHVTLGNGNTLWGMADASSPDSDGWQHIPVDPRVMAARVAGLSHGFLVFDDTGSEWTRSGEAFSLRVFPNRFVFSREQNRASAPFFTVEPGARDDRPPPAPIDLRIEGETGRLPSGEALLTWLTPADLGPAGTLGFDVTINARPVPRELIPLAAGPGERVEMHVRDLNIRPGETIELAVRGVDAAANRGPAATARVTVSARVASPLPTSGPEKSAGRKASEQMLPRIAGMEVAVIDELDKINPVSGALIPGEAAGYLAGNHLWNAQTKQITVQAARNEFVAFQVVLRGPSPVGRFEPALRFEAAGDQAIAVEIGRYYPIASTIGPMPDPIVPLSHPVDADPKTICHSLHVEIYVPDMMASGVHRGLLRLTIPGETESLELPVALQVWDFTLPDHLSFLPEMNCYGLPDNERAFYRLAHRHRTVLNRVPYSQSGHVAPGCAPGWDGRRLKLDWAEWDTRFGPLLDGSAFADVPRSGVPVDRFYLPLHENWPAPMDGNYRGGYWADREFPESYRRAFVAASRQIAEHASERGWANTLLECFFNNKNNFKARGWSRGSSPWLFDEPANFQDFWALRYFAQAFHEGINQASVDAQSGRSPRPKLVFRADISRPQWRRDSLDGLLDDHVVSSAMRAYPNLVFERKRIFDEIVLEYGSTNPIERSNLQPLAWCLDAWSQGADGVVPWQTVGNADSWNRGDDLALFYPANKPSTSAEPIPSIRLKAYRRGQQDVEYLTLWSQVIDEPRWAVGQRVRSDLKLAAKRRGTGVTEGEDAGRLDYDRLHSSDAWKLRTAIGEALSRARPKPKTKLVEFRTPTRNLNRTTNGRTLTAPQSEFR
jgi:hypothetical protein